MEGNPNPHLGVPELARLLEEARERQGPDAGAGNLHPHIAACSACREQFEALALFDSQLKTMRVATAAAPQASCPDRKVWGEVVGGIAKPDQVLAYVEHASSCEHCGPQLRAAVGEFSDLNRELTASERKQVAGLESAKPQWQMKLAGRITGKPLPSPVSQSWWQRWASAPSLAAAALLAIVVVASAWWVSGERGAAASANQLLAQAYSDQRTLELRFPGAEYAPMRVQRGPAASFTARPSALLKAEAIIAGKLGDHPDDPAWLQAAARANVLEGKYDASVESLQRALELQPNSPELLADLGTAHFQRAQSEDRREDFGAAFEYFSQVLALQPDNAIALFNRAIVAEHQSLYRQALDDWEHYLKLDTRSQWADEARNRAEAVRARLKEHGGLPKPLLAPAELSPAVMDSEVDERVEEYLAEAVRTWLPRGFPESGAREADPGAQRALFLLAGLTNRQHEDHWLSDLLQGSSAPNFRRAIAALAQSRAANDAGDYGTAAQQATSAEQLFRGSGNMAGTLRAQFEHVLAAQLSRRSEECRRQASTFLAESKKYSYPWLQIQFSLEEGVCAELMGDLGTPEKSTGQAMDLARKAGYGAAYLRAVGFLADDEFSAGNSPEAWKIVSKGMERYWSGQFAALRGYLLYNVLGSRIDAAKEPHLLVAIWREAVGLIDSDEDLAMRADAHNKLANAAAAARQLPLAEAEYAEGARLFALAPRTGASLASALDSEIRIAQLEARQGHFDAAVERLTQNQNQIRQLSNNYLAQMFFSALGELQLRNHQPSEAEQSLRLALELAGKNLASLNSETQRILWSKDAAPVYLAMSEAELAQGRAQESLAVYESYLGAAWRADAGDKQTAPGAEADSAWLSSRLPMLAGETVISYAVLPDGLAIWTYDNRGVKVQWLPEASHDLPEIAERLYDSCADPHSELSAVRRDAHSLYTALISPIEDRLEPGRTLVVEANGWPARVPFEALLDGNGHSLIERWPIVHSLGQYSDARMRSPGKISSSEQALVIGSTASSQAGDLIPLPNVVAEAEMIARGFQSAEVLTAQDATLDAVMEKLPSAQVFHFTGHSLATTQHAGLLLAGAQALSGGPRLLEAATLRRLDLRRLQLGVLSTCSIESGTDGARGFSSVAEALERSGVPHVVASRWPVDSVETRRLMESFYRSLLSGQSVSNALRSTAQEMLSNPRTVHPYFWAAFVAYGRP